MHYPFGLQDEYFEQLTAEKQITRYVKGFPKREWVKSPNDRNEALDLEVYCYAAAVYAGVTRINWEKLEERLNLNQPDLFNRADQDKATDTEGTDDMDTQKNKDLVPSQRPGAKVKRKRRKAGFVNSY